jgi:hypothetical protein
MSQGESKSKRLVFCDVYKMYISAQKLDAKLETFSIMTKMIIKSDVIFISDLLSTIVKHLKNNDKNLDDFLECYSDHLSLSNDYNDKDNEKNNGPIVLKTLLNFIRRLKNKYHLTKYIYGFQGFRNCIKKYPKSMNGYTAMSDSIFSGVTEPSVGSLMTNLDTVIRSFKPLLEDKTIRMDLTEHLNFIFNSNIGFTYSDPNMMNRETMSTMDFCVLCLNIMTEVTKKSIKDKNGQDNKYLMKTFMLSVDIVYLSIYVMKTTVGDSINFYNLKIQELSEMEKHNKLSKEEETFKSYCHDTLEKGIIMMNTLISYTKTIDTEYIDSMIFHTIDVMISDKMYDYISRLINSFGVRPLVTMNHFFKEISEIIVKLVNDPNVPVPIKFDAMRLIMSHNLKKYIFEIPDSHSIIVKYILSDVKHMKELNNVHLIDLMVELSDTTIMTDSSIIELYMYLVPDFIDQYTQILNTFNDLSNEHKANAMDDIRKFIEATCLMVINIPVLGRYALSYINSLFEMIYTICNMSKLIKNTSQSDSPHELLEKYEKIYVDRIKDIVDMMLTVLVGELNISNEKVIINNNSLKILTDTLGLIINNPDHKDTLQLKIIDKDNLIILPNVNVTEITDVITYEIVMNPYFIKTSNQDNAQICLIDRKTYFSICRTQLNPFTREHIDKETLDNFNKTNDIEQKRKAITEKVNKL